MRNFIFTAICIILLMLTIVACGSNAPQTRNAELVVTYHGKKIKHERPTWYNEAQLREEIKKPGEKYLIFGTKWCKACTFLRKALDQADVLNKVVFIDIDEPWAAQISKIYGINAVPTMLEIGKNTNITDVKVGPASIVMHMLLK